MMVDERMFQIGSYISNDSYLLEVVSVREVSKFPNRRRVITAENCKSGKVIPLKEEELKSGGFYYVESDGQKTLTEAELTYYTLVPDTFPMPVSV